MASSPIVARWELSRRLAALRKDRGLDVKAITDHLGFTRNYWSAVENDRTLIAADKLELLLDLFEVDDAERTELTTLREDGRKRGWWAEHAVINDMVKRLCGLEAGASSIRAYESHYAPGLLQTEAYARAVIRSDPSSSLVELDQLVEIRLRRQLVLSAKEPVNYQAVLSEAVLFQEHAGAEAQARQLRHLADLLEQHEHIDVRILPFTSSPGIISSASTLLFFDFGGGHGGLPTLGWQESLTDFGPVEPDHVDFRRLELAWEVAFSASLGREQSLKRIREQAAHYPEH